MAEKYSEYYIELPKMDDYTKAEIPEAYHDLWDLCCIFRAKINEQEEVIRMQAVANPIALELAGEVRKAVAPNDFVNDTLNRKNEFEQLRDYMKRREQKAAQLAAQAEKQKLAEEMLITAFQNAVPLQAIEAMRQNAGITEARLAELKEQANKA